jgi:N-methylhydantoinase A/oxoprolinase/acetone carboxylase beta subunit
LSRLPVLGADLSGDTQVTETLRVGVDVGGTNTDAVVLRGREVLAQHKAPTSSDVGTGIVQAIRDVLAQAGVPVGEVAGVMIGTTHFTNAFVEGKHLSRVGVLRLGAPTSLSVRPFADWPDALIDAVGGHAAIVAGGYNYDGRPIRAVNPGEIRRVVAEFAARDIRAVAISSVFAPVNKSQEEEVAAIVSRELPGVQLTLSSEIGRIGLIERENATIMNSALLAMADRVVGSFRRALAQLGIRAPFFVSQNDGTLLDPDSVVRFPVLTFASGPTNSMRGAAFLTGAMDALVVDIGGTTTDAGALVNGFPRESSIAVDIGGVRTNFRMPDILSIGLGGGSLITAEDGRMRVGPQSVGYRILSEALVFGGTRLTATDIAVAAGYAEIGDRDRVRHLDKQMVAAAVDEIHRLAEETLDRMKTTASAARVILVGGGSVLINRELKGVGELTVPRQAAVANAIGAAIAQVSGEVDRIFSYDELGRDRALQDAHADAVDGAIAAGALPDTVHIVDVEELPLQYLPGGAVRIRVKAVGDVALERAP